MQHHAADQLDVEVALPEGALAGLARERERLVQQVLERLAGEVALTQRLVALAQLLVRFELQLGLEVVDACDVALEELELLRLAYPQCAVEDGHSSYGSKAPGLADPAREAEPERVRRGAAAALPSAPRGARGACRGAS